MFGDGPRRRGRSDQTTSKTPPSGPITDVYGAELSTSEISRVFGGTNNGVFRSSTTRAILVTACFAFVMISLVGAWSARRSTSIKDISDAVMKLSLQLREAELENERHVRQLQIYDKEVSDKDVELAWEHQHVDDAEEALKIERRSALGQIEKDRKAIKEAAELLDELADEVTAKEIQIQKEHQESEKNKWMLDVTVESLMAQEARHKMESEENADLKNQLAHAIEDLANIRAQLPLAPGTGGQAEDFYLRRNKRKLRGKSNYQPGDNVEIIEYQGGGRIALQPGELYAFSWTKLFSLFASIDFERRTSSIEHTWSSPFVHVNSNFTRYCSRDQCQRHLQFGEARSEHYGPEHEDGAFSYVSSL